MDGLDQVHGRDHRAAPCSRGKLDTVPNLLGEAASQDQEEIPTAGYAAKQVHEDFVRKQLNISDVWGEPAQRFMHEVEQIQSETVRR